MQACVCICECKAHQWFVCTVAIVVVGVIAANCVCRLSFIVVAVVVVSTNFFLWENTLYICFWIFTVCLYLCRFVSVYISVFSLIVCLFVCVHWLLKLPLSLQCIVVYNTLLSYNCAKMRETRNQRNFMSFTGCTQKEKERGRCRMSISNVATKETLIKDHKKSSGIDSYLST